MVEAGIIIIQVLTIAVILEAIAATTLLFLLWYWFRSILTSLIWARIRGMIICFYIRGLHITPILAPKGVTSIEYEDKNKQGHKWEIPEEGAMKLLPGNISVTFCIDRLPFTFAPDTILALALEMANTHIKNMHTFSKSIMNKDTGQPVYDEIPFLDREGNPQKDEKGEPIVQRVQRKIYAIDPNHPDYEYPDTLSSQSYSEKTKIEGMKYSRNLRSDQIKKPMLYAIVGGSLLVFAGVAIVIVKMGLDYSLCDAAIKTTTTIVTTTTLLMPPGGL